MNGYYEHTPDCVQSEEEAPGDDCRPVIGEWSDPPVEAVRAASAELGPEAPWCQVRRRALEVDG